MESRRQSETREYNKTLDEDIEKSVDEALEAEKEYIDFVESEREKNANKDNENTIEDEFVDLELDEYTGRVVKISAYNSYEGRKFDLTIIRYNGEKFNAKLDFALPEETGSNWIRLCTWLDVHPHRGSDMMGEIVPITMNEYGKPTLFIPPIKKGLNPLHFKLYRFMEKHNLNGFKLPEYTKSILLWLFTFIAIGVVIHYSLTLALGIFATILYIFFILVKPVKDLFKFMSDVYCYLKRFFKFGKKSFMNQFNKIIRILFPKS